MEELTFGFGGQIWCTGDYLALQMEHWKVDQADSRFVLRNKNELLGMKNGIANFTVILVKNPP